LSLTERHELIKNVILALCQQVGLVVSADPVKPGPNKTPDLSIFTSKGDFCVDVSVVHPLAPSHMKVDDPIDKREKEKRQKYKTYTDETNRSFIPAVVDTFGKFGPGMHQIAGILSNGRGVQLQGRRGAGAASAHCSGAAQGQLIGDLTRADALQAAAGDAAAGGAYYRLSPAR